MGAAVSRPLRCDSNDLRRTRLHVHVGLRIYSHDSNVRTFKKILNVQTIMAHGHHLERGVSKITIYLSSRLALVIKLDSHGREWPCLHERISIVLTMVREIWITNGQRT